MAALTWMTRAAFLYDFFTVLGTILHMSPENSGAKNELGAVSKETL